MFLVAYSVGETWSSVMKLSTRSCRIALPLVAAALVAGVNVASAATFTYSSYSVTNEQDITILTPNSISGGAGQIKLIGSGANAGVVTNDGADILAWCLNIYTYLANSGTYTVGTLTTAGTGGSNPTLTTTQIGEIGALMLNGDAIINSSTNVSAAIQLAIWKIEYGNTFTSSGLSSAVTTLANTYISDVNGGSWGPDYNVSLLSESDNQNLGFVTPTPLPSTWTMMLIGAAGLGFFAYRGTKNRAAAIAAA
jgi:hypothetical protein